MARVSRWFVHTFFGWVIDLTVKETTRTMCVLITELIDFGGQQGMTPEQQLDLVRQFCRHTKTGAETS